MKIINKATLNDLREQLSRQLDAYIVDIDLDNLYVIAEEGEFEDGKYTTELCRYSFTWENGIATLDEASEVTVVKNTDYTVITDEPEEDMVEESLSKSIIKTIKSTILSVLKDSNTPSLVPVRKGLQEEAMISIEPLYIAVGEVDGHGHTIESYEDMVDLVKSFNEANDAGTLQMSLFHTHKTNCFKIIKASVYDHDCYIDDVLIPALQPIAEVKYLNKQAWELRKSGLLSGLSIGAMAVLEEV